MHINVETSPGNFESKNPRGDLDHNILVSDLWGFGGKLPSDFAIEKSRFHNNVPSFTTWPTVLNVANIVTKFWAEVDDINILSVYPQSNSIVGADGLDSIQNFKGIMLCLNSVDTNDALTKLIPNQAPNGSNKWIYCPVDKWTVIKLYGGKITRCDMASIDAAAANNNVFMGAL